MEVSVERYFGSQVEGFSKVLKSRFFYLVEERAEKREVVEYL